MQRIALLGDLHGNLVATKAMEEALNALQVDEIWFLGDAVGKGPQSRETCDWVRAHCARFIRGNWDQGIGMRKYPEDGYFWEQLGEERLNWLANLPLVDDVWVSGTHFRLFHGRPVTPLMGGEADSAQLSRAFEGEGQVYTGIIYADCHRPFLRTLHAGYALNTGSVGNSTGVPKAHALLLEGEIGSQTPAPLLMTTLSVPYDNEAAAAIACADEALPHREAFVRELLTGVYSR